MLLSGGTMLSPTEALGLRGATLETRVRKGLRQVSDAAFARIERRLADDALASAVVYERDGAPEPVRILLRPLIVMPDQLSYVHHVTTRVLDALRQLPTLYFDDHDVRRILRLHPDEDAWLRAAWTPAHANACPIYGRLDAVCDFSSAGWRESLQMMEANLSGVGGIHYAPIAEQLVMRDVVPTLLAHDPELSIELPRDQRELFLQVLLDHARTLGCQRANLCFIEPKYERVGADEMPALIADLQRRHDGAIVHADPRELRLEGDDVYYEDVRVDVAYRDYETRDLIALCAREGCDLAAMRALLRQNRMVSSIGGDFDHKSCLEVLTDDALAARYFSADERRLFARHVLWTRVVADVSTGLPRGEGSLLEYARTHREELVLKPNRGFGGRDVHLGALESAAAWDALLEQAARQADDPYACWVVQAATTLPVHEFPVMSEAGNVVEEPFYVVMGFAPTDGGLGVLCRASQKRVVNVAQRGGLVAMLVGRPPSELRTPLRSPPRAPEREARLRAQIEDLRGLDLAIGLLGWDEETYLPEGGRAGRGQQLGTLEGLRHRLLTADALGDLIEEVAAHSEPDSLLFAELARLRRLRRISMALPAELVREFAKARSHALARWEQARADDDFALFAPAFRRVVELSCERADALRRGDDRYDGLLDENEPGMTRARLEPLLYSMRDRLVPLARTLHERTRSAQGRVPGGSYDVAVQESLCRSLLSAMGFDFRRGRVDHSTHPFTLMAGEDDVRLTLRFSERDPITAIFTALHEGGHALYDQGFARELHGTLLADGPGMAIHEGQARLWENQIGRTLGFWQYFTPRLRAAFPGRFDAVAPEALYRAVNTVRPGPIRVGADEVTYDLHIALRYELELALISGALPVAELPLAWTERSEALLGVRPRGAREGALQDVHWALGMFGYFPSYTLGNLHAAQLMESFSAQHTDFERELRDGDMRALLGWLREHVHGPGHRYSAEQLLERATGARLGMDAFFRMLARRHELS
jgi:carboxypeptidase Taq